VHPYRIRAATLVLVWTELLDDVDEAESCAGPDALQRRLELFRRELRGFLLRVAAPVDDPEKWVQRSFWNAPPRKGALRDDWRPILLEWAASTRLGREALADVDRAIAALFADGAEAWAALLASRPALLGAVRRCVGDADVPDPSEWTAPFVVEDLWLPVFFTDGEIDRVVWANASFRAFLGVAPDRVRQLRLPDVAELVGRMSLPGDASFNARHDRMLASGRAMGRGVMQCRVDLALRDWVSAPTPPWSGRYALMAFGHVLFGPDGRRAGSACVYALEPLDDAG
jgi:hypothetical protein